MSAQYITNKMSKYDLLIICYWTTCIDTWQEQLEKKKADYAEKMKNKVAMIHKQAEEKRAMVEARRGEDMLKAEEMAAKFRATGHTPKSGCGCLGW